jgi:uncharacterized membrane protein
MEGFGGLVVLVVLGVVVGLPVWFVLAIAQLRRQAEHDQFVNSEHWQDLKARLSVLERQFHELKETFTAQRQTVSEAHSEAATPIQKDTPPVPGTSRAPVAEPPLPEVKAPEPVAPHAVHEPVVQRPPRYVLPELPPVAKPAVTQIPPPVSQPSDQIPAPTFSQPVSSQPVGRGFDLEQVLGTNWLNKIGIGILVLGLAFFIAYQLQNLGPAGKVLFGVVLSVGMVAAGIRYESNQRYRLLARASAAGGWSLFYFVSYAIYHVPAAHVIDSRELDFFLMLVVAAAIVGYSLRYRSQATTALALVLSYLTVGIHHTSVYSLGASVVLAGTVVVLALRMEWYGLELLGILATYFNHLLWAFPTIGLNILPIRSAEWRTSVTLLTFYWLLFRCSYIFRRIRNKEQERLSTASALANGFCLLALLKLHSVNPEWTFPCLLALGMMELVFSALAARRRRTAFIVLATLGSTLIIAAVPFHYSGANLSILWLAAAEAFLLVGVFLREVVFRRIGMITLVVVAGQMIFDTGASLLEERFTDLSNLPANYATAVLFFAAGAFCYFNSHWLRERWRELFEHEFDSALIGAISYLGGLLVLIAAWLATPSMWTAMTWAALALALNLAANKFRQQNLSVQGNLIAVVSIVRLITLNLWTADQWHGISLRLVTVGGTVLLLYVAAPFAQSADGSEQQSSWLTAAYTWAASILGAWLLWLELPPTNVAIGWMVLGLLLLEIGLQSGAGFLRWQGYTALAASFFGMLALNLDIATAPGQPSARTSRMASLAVAYLFTDWRLRRSGVKSEEALAGAAFSYCGVVSIATLLFYELQPDWVAAGWSALAFVMIAAAWGLRRRDYLRQSYMLAAAAAVQATMHNLFGLNLIQFNANSLPGSVQRYCVGTAVAFLFGCLPFAFLLRRLAADQSKTEFGDGIHPEQVFFFIPFGLLTALIAFESSRGQLTMSWGIEGLATFLFAVWVGERSFRLAGLGLLLLCVAKIFLIDVWGLDPQSRYITLIILGGALLLVSFLYTRHKEKFSRYL